MLIKEDQLKTAAALNDLARLKMREKLLKDVACDLIICRIEGFCPKKYISDLKIEIDDVYKRITKNEKE